MPYVVINASNAFDPIHQVVYATAEEADTAARDLLNAQPQATVRTAQLLNTYTAKVTVTAMPVPDAEQDPIA
jgi:hypothetical protein